MTKNQAMVGVAVLAFAYMRRAQLVGWWKSSGVVAGSAQAKMLASQDAAFYSRAYTSNPGATL